jgi:nucleoside-diphosphate-sugar epimerase
LLFSISAKGSAYYPPGGSGFITVNDVVRMMVKLMDSDVRNERFILVDKNLTYKEILSNVAREFGKHPPTKALKFWQLNLLWRLDWLRNRLSGSHRVVTKKGVAAMKNKQIYSNKKILKYFNYEYEMMAEAIYFSCNRFKESNPKRFS